MELVSNGSVMVDGVDVTRLAGWRPFCVSAMTLAIGVASIAGLAGDRALRPGPIAAGLLLLAAAFAERLLSGRTEAAKARRATPLDGGLDVPDEPAASVLGAMAWTVGVWGFAILTLQSAWPSAIPAGCMLIVASGLIGMGDWLTVRAIEHLRGGHALRLRAWDAAAGDLAEQVDIYRSPEALAALGR